MKKKFLALAFAAAMLLGTATMTWANDWNCITWQDDCFGYAIICGDGEGEELVMQQQKMLAEWYEIYEC